MKPIPYWLQGGVDIAESRYRPFGRTGALVRLIVRRVRPTPGSQLALFCDYDYHPFHHRPAGLNPGPEGRPSPRRGRTRHLRSQVRRGSEASALGMVRCQHRLAAAAVLVLVHHATGRGPVEG